VRTSRYDLLITAGAVVSFLTYAEVLAQYLPMGHTRAWISIGVLALVGLSTGALMTTTLRAKLALITFVPIAHFLLVGIDPAKPGLSYLIAVIELACLWIGISMTHFLVRKRHGNA
jgi:hypothetical protein